MAPKTIDYSNTIIYKLEHENDKTLFYVGSTTDFIRRKYCHKSRCNNPNGKKYNLKVYQMIRDNGGWECFKMVELKKFPCNDSNEAFAEEERFREKLNPSMNSYSAYSGLTKEDYNKQWYIANIDYKKERNKEWRDNNTDYHKNYRINNKDKIRERRSQKITCDCGAIVCKEGLSKHLDTGKHFRWKQNNNIQ